MRSGITRRWLRGNLLITVLVVLLAEAMFLYSYTRSYYGSVQQIMYRRFSSVTGQLKMYTGDTAQSAAASRSLALRRMVEQFADKDKYEFMLLDSYGGVIASSSGTDAEGIVSSKDFEQALNGPDGLGVAVYRTQSGEVVMAACSLVPYDAEDVAALRLVTSLALVERQVKNAIIISVFLAVAILLFTIMSGLYFVRGIVVPLGQVERTAAGSARGELEITDLNRIYLEDNSLNVELLGQGFTWLDTGTHESLVDATNFVKTMEQHQHRKKVRKHQCFHKSCKTDISKQLFFHKHPSCPFIL